MRGPDGIYMFGLDELKSAIKVTETGVECPVKGCLKKVLRQRESFKRLEEFKCPNHRIYVSPSTFEYEDMFDNVLWRDKTDHELLTRIIGTKRESRIARDNSEDALVWNVFRFLEKNQLVARFLENLVNHHVENPEVIYWSYSQSLDDVWLYLKTAREEFETIPKKGSEPDLIVKSDKTLFFIEAKLSAANDTALKTKNPKVQEKYETGGNRWYQKVFNSDFKTIALKNKKYELLRFWLIGSWIAHQLGLDFCLINLVPSEKEIDIAGTFKKHINESPSRTFLRASWEEIYRFIKDSELKTQDRSTLIEYFENKTTGYKNGRLQKAFAISN